MSALIDPRDPAAIIARMAMLAFGTDIPLAPQPPGPRTWHQLLFTDTRLNNPSAADQALLAAYARLGSGLAEHLNTVPDALHTAWLRDVLEIPTQSAVSDVVPLSVTLIAPGTSAFVKQDSEVTAKDSAGRIRYYRTNRPLVAHGSVLAEVRAYHARRQPDGGIADCISSWADRASPFEPFTVKPAQSLAPHRFRIADPILAISGTASRATVAVTFTNTDVRKLSGTRWFYSTAEGTAEAVASVNAATSTVDLEITRPCMLDPAAANLPWLDMVIDEQRDALDAEALGVSFTDISVSVKVTALPAEDVFYNDGKLNLEQEVQPLGPVPQRGDAFYVRSAEAFSKPLQRLAIDLGEIKAYGTTFPFGVDTDYLADLFAQQWPGPGKSTITGIIALPIGRVDQLGSVQWQYRSGGSWHEIVSEYGVLASLADTAVTTAQPGVGFSEPSEQAGASGHSVRASLIDGDLGWTRYQSRLAEFAAKAVNKTHPVDPDELMPPEPPAITQALISYQTAPVRPRVVTSVDGWSRRSWRPGIDEVYAPFRVPVTLLDTEGAESGILDFGFDIVDGALGDSLSVYLDVRSVGVGAVAGQSEWLAAAPDRWEPVPVADATRGLRQSGLLQVATPPSWPRGCADSGDTAATLRWLRLASTEPGRLGTLTQVVPDVVEATQVDTELVAPDQPLQPGQVKGLTTAPLTVKKVANLVGRGGRSLESPSEYRRRGSALVRHRDRAVQAWDYEELARQAVPDAAAIRCLPHTCSNAGLRPGDVALVVVPTGSEAMPIPTVALAERITAALTPRMPVTARLSIIAPLYRPVTIEARVQLAAGVPGLVGRETIREELERWLHPAAAHTPRFGRTLYGSEVTSFLESLDIVDHLEHFNLFAEDAGVPVDLVEVEPLRGLVSSSARHNLTVAETL